MTEHYRENGKRWKGLTQYECAIDGCLYDSTNPAVMESHWERHHAQEQRFVPTGLLDSSGRPVMRQTED